MTQALSYEDLCELSEKFNKAADLRVPQQYRINEALKEALGRAAEYFPNEVIHLRAAVTKRKKSIPLA